MKILLNRKGKNEKAKSAEIKNDNNSNSLYQFAKEKQNSQYLIAEKSGANLGKIKEQKIEQLLSGSIFPNDYVVNEPKLNEVLNYKFKHLGCGSLIAYRLVPNTDKAEIAIGFRGGARFGSIGLAHLTEHMVMKMAEFKLQSVRDDMSKNGASTSACTSMNGMRFVVKCKNEDVSKYVKLVCDLIVNNEYDEKVFEQEKFIIENEAMWSAENFKKKNLKDRFTDELGDTAGKYEYIIGDKNDLKAIKLSDVVDYKNKYFNLDNLVIVADLQRDYSKFYDAINDNLLSRLKNAESADCVAGYKVLQIKKDAGSTYNILRANGGCVNVVVALKKMNCANVDALIVKNVVKFILSKDGAKNRERLRDENGLCYSRMHDYILSNGAFIVENGATCFKENVRKVIILQLNMFKDLLKNGMDANQFANFKTWFLNAYGDVKGSFNYSLGKGSLFDYCSGESYITNKEQIDVYNKIASISLDEINKILNQFYMSARLQVLLEGDVALSQLPSVNVLNAIKNSVPYGKMGENMADLSGSEIDKAVKIYRSAYDLSGENGLSR